MLCFRSRRRPVAAPLAMLLALGVASSARAEPAPSPAPPAAAPSPAATDGAAPPSSPSPAADGPSAQPSTPAPATAEPETTTDEPDLAAPDADQADQADEAADLDAEDDRIDEPDLDQVTEDGEGSEDSGPVGLAVPERLEPLPRAGWWSLFGAFTLGTTAGVLAGLAERQEDKALRLTLQLDVESGQAPLYADEQDTYEEILRRGERLQTGAIVLGAFAGAAAIAGITLFVLDAKRGRATETARRTKLRGSGIEVRF